MLELLDTCGQKKNPDLNSTSYTITQDESQAELETTKQNKKPTTNVGGSWASVHTAQQVKGQFESGNLSLGTDCTELPFDLYLCAVA